jgi:hypothetical protein
LYLDGCDQLSDDAFDCLILSDAEADTTVESSIVEEKSPSDVEKMMESILSKDQESMSITVPPDLGTSEDQINF